MTEPTKSNSNLMVVLIVVAVLLVLGCSGICVISMVAGFGMVQYKTSVPLPRVPADKLERIDRERFGEPPASPRNEKPGREDFSIPTPDGPPGSIDTEVTIPIPTDPPHAQPKP